MAVERAAGGTSLIDVLDRVLDKGIVIDAWVRVSLVGIDLITVEARVVVASIDTYLKYSEAVGQVSPGVAARRPSSPRHQSVIAENAALARGACRRQRHSASAGQSRRAVVRSRAGTAEERPPKDKRCSRRSRPPCRCRGSIWKRRLALAEFLLSSTDLQASARRAVDWLVAHTDVEQAVVAVADALSGQILLVAEHGVSSTAIADFALSREDEAHPLVRRSRATEPTYFERKHVTVSLAARRAVSRDSAAIGR